MGSGLRLIRTHANFICGQPNPMAEIPSEGRMLAIFPHEIRVLYRFPRPVYQVVFALAEIDLCTAQVTPLNGGQ